MKINYNGMPISFPEGTSQEDANAWIANNKDVADAELAKYNAKNELVTDKASTLLSDMNTINTPAPEEPKKSKFFSSPEYAELDKKLQDNTNPLKNDDESTRVLKTIGANIWDTLVDAGDTVVPGLSTAKAIVNEATGGESGKVVKDFEESVKPDKSKFKPETVSGQVIAEMAPYLLTGTVGAPMRAATAAGKAAGTLATRLGAKEGGKLAGAANRVAANTAASVGGATINNDLSTEEGRNDAILDTLMGGILGAGAEKALDVGVNVAKNVAKGSTAAVENVVSKVKAGNKSEKKAIQEAYESGKVARKYGKEVKDDLIDTVNADSHNYPEGDGALSRIFTSEGKPNLNPSQVFKDSSKFTKSEKRSLANNAGDVYTKRFEDQATGKSIRSVSEDSSLMHPFITRPDGTQYVARPLGEIMDDIVKLNTKEVKGVTSPNTILSREISAGRFTSPEAIKAASAIAKENPSEAYLADELATRGSIELRNKAINEATRGSKIDSIKYEAEVDKVKDSLNRLSGIESGKKPYAAQKKVGQDIEDALRIMDGSRGVPEDSKLKDFIGSALPALGLTSAITGETGFGPLDAIVAAAAYGGKRGFNKIRDARNVKRSEGVISKILADKDVGRNGEVNHLSDMIKSVKSGDVNATYSTNMQGFNSAVDTIGDALVNTGATAARSVNSDDSVQAPHSSSTEIYDYVEPSAQDMPETQPQNVSGASMGQSFDAGTNAVVDAIVKAETGGMKDPFVFTGGMDKNATAHSSAYGPGQITTTLANDFLTRKPELFNDAQREYLELMVEQGKIMLDNARNGVKGTALSYGGKGLLGETEEDRKLYKEVMSVMIQDSLKENNGNLTKTLRSWRGVGADKDPRWWDIVYKELDNTL